LFLDPFEQSEYNDLVWANATKEENNATWTYVVDENNGKISEEESENPVTFNENQWEETNTSWTYIIEENNSTMSEDNSDYNGTFYEFHLEQYDTAIDQIGIITIIYDRFSIYR